VADITGHCCGGHERRDEEGDDETFEPALHDDGGRMTGCGDAVGDMSDLMSIKQLNSCKYVRDWQNSTMQNNRSESSSCVINLPQGMAYGWWHFPSSKFENLMFEVELSRSVSATDRCYIQLYQGHIGGVGMYFGFQTDIWKPGCGWQGKGLIFSRWETRDNENAQAVPGGWVESSGHEGDFVGVRSIYDWDNSKYLCWLKPVQQDNVGIWYQFGVRNLNNNVESSAGCLRFPFVNGTNPLIESGGGSWTEVYGESSIDAKYLSETLVTVRNVNANDGVIRPNRCDTSYNQNFTFSDCSVSLDGELTLRSGGEVIRKHNQNRYNLPDCYL
jgi:hypothetical protein